MNQYSSKENAYLNMMAHVLRASDAIDSAVCAVLKEADLTHVQFNILRILQGARPKPLSAGQINERMMFTKSDMTRLLDRLESKDMISRETCSYNRRKLDICITPKGNKIIQKMLPLIEGALHGFFDEKIEPQDRDAVIRAMDTISTTLSDG